MSRFDPYVHLGGEARQWDASPLLPGTDTHDWFRLTKEQLRQWHARTRLGPADHPLLQLDQPDYGFRNNTNRDAAAVNAIHIAGLSGQDTKHGPQERAD